MQARKLLSLGKATVQAWMDDKASSAGAALAYYAMFSMIPLLILLIAVAGLIFGADAARAQIVTQLGALMDPAGAATINELLERANRPENGVTATLISSVTLLIGATTVLAELQSALDRIWKAPAANRPKGLWGLLRARFLSLGMILAMAFLLIVSLTLSAALAALGTIWGGQTGAWLRLLEAINFLFTFIVTTTVVAMIYKLLPSVKIRWRDVWLGAAITALLLALGKFLIGLYIGKTGIASGFGAAGSLVIILIWVYYSAQIFLLGAEFTWVVSQSHEKRKGAAP